MRRREGLIKESRGCDYQNTEGLSCASLSLSFFFRTPWRPSVGLPRSWFVLQGSNGVSKAQGERGESYQLLKATTLSSGSPSTVVLFIWEDRSHVLSSTWASPPQISIYFSLCQNYLGSSTFQATQARVPQQGGAVVSVCGAVFSPCGAATWCGPALL